MSAYQFQRMRSQLRELFPAATDGEIQHGCNLIGRELRKSRYDIYEVALHATAEAREPGYHVDFTATFGSGKYTVHVQVKVD